MPFSRAEAIDRSSHAMFSPKVRIVCKPSASFRTSSGVNPCTEFQYCDDTIGMFEMVKNWLSDSNVTDAPPRYEYRITDIGVSLLPIIDSMLRWGEEHYEVFEKKYGKRQLP